MAAAPEPGEYHAGLCDAVQRHVRHHLAGTVLGRDEHEAVGGRIVFGAGRYRQMAAGHAHLGDQDRGDRIEPVDLRDDPVQCGGGLAQGLEREQADAVVRLRDIEQRRADGGREGQRVDQASAIGQQGRAAARVLVEQAQLFVDACLHRMTIGLVAIGGEGGMVQQVREFARMLGVLIGYQWMWHGRISIGGRRPDDGDRRRYLHIAGAPNLNFCDARKPCAARLGR
ncbi:hypothetical protein PPH41_13430 [Burkholderia gladioli]|nr:hypothetical protein [Burkholderia gladioli]